MQVVTTDRYTLYCGDCLAVMGTMEANSCDTIVTDPPYGLAFMGKEWDHGVPGVPFWEAALRVAKPGAMLLAFGGTRTFHRLTCAIEDAGWEVRDVIIWLYGSGFPKSHDISKGIDKAAGATREVVGVNTAAIRNKTRSTTWTGDVWGDNGATITAPATPLAAQWQGWGTALKPAWEPIIVAMKPLDGTFAQNAQRHGVAGLNIEGARIGTTKDVPASGARIQNGNAWTKTNHEAVGSGFNPNIGRWPANLILDEDAAAALDAQSGERKAGVAVRHNSGGNTFGGSNRKPAMPDMTYSDTGGASRFFKTCSLEETELFFCSAKDIIDAWNLDLANTAEHSLYPSSELVVSVLSRAVTAASRGDVLLSDIQAHFTNVTQTELRKLCETTIATILCLEKRQSPDQWQGAHFPNGCHARFAETPKQTGITTITISHWKSDGYVDDATFSITSRSMAHGGKDSANRFAYVAKASRAEREAGLEGMEEKPKESHIRQSAGRQLAGQDLTLPMRNHHPTVKPLTLMRYLVRLTATPTGGVVLDPFMGSGTTGVAAMMEGRQFIGIDLEPEYVEIAKRRIEHAAALPRQEGLL